MSVRNMAAFFVSNALLLTGKVKKACKKAHEGQYIISVYFHSPEKKLFTSCVKWFLKNGFTFLSLDDIENIANGKKRFPKSGVVFTVDDGWRSNKENIAAVANEYKVPVAIFASTQPIEKDGAYWWSYIGKAKNDGLISQGIWDLKKVPNEERVAVLEKVKETVTLPREALTVEELKEISATPYVHIGSHTVTHPIISQCSDAVSEYELTESKHKLESWLNKKVDHFAYPNGEFRQREIDLLKKSGYTLAFTTVPDYLTPESLQKPFELPRFDVLEDISFAENICRMTGAWFNRKLL